MPDEDAEKPDVLLAVPGYKALVERVEEGNSVRNMKHVNSSSKRKVARDALRKPSSDKEKSSQSSSERCVTEVRALKMSF